MKKEFQSTIEESVEAQLRLAELIGIVWKLKWIGLIVAPGVIILLCFFLLNNLAAKLIIGGSGAGLFIPYHLSTYKKNYRKRIRKVIKKTLGTDQPIPSEYEMDETGLIFRQLGQEMKFSWGNVQEIIQTDNSIEVLMKPIGIVIIPKRIFSKPTEWQAWVTYIYEHIGSNNPSGGDLQCAAPHS